MGEVPAPSPGRKSTGPGDTGKFNSYHQPSLGGNRLAVFRERSQGRTSESRLTASSPAT